MDMMKEGGGVNPGSVPHVTWARTSEGWGQHVQGRRCRLLNLELFLKTELHLDYIWSSGWVQNCSWYPFSIPIFGQA